MSTMSIVGLEQAINQCKRLHPPVDYVLSPELRMLATLWGDMIYRHIETIELDALPAELKSLVERWHLGIACDVCQ